MQSLAHACVPRDSVFDRSKRDTVLDLTDLSAGAIDANEFFAENHVTDGMRVLLSEGFKRLEGKSDQGVFKLTQSMGGGKTHNMLAFGLLAQHPGLRRPVMSDFYTPNDMPAAQVIAFTGRESDAPYGIWGAIAEQLGKRDQFGPYYSPLSAPGQNAWVQLLASDRPTLILLDELPPYFEQAKARTIGNSDLSVVTATALSNLLVAVGKEELSNVCVVISDLTASYDDGKQVMDQALNNLNRETGRVAQDLVPVRLNTNEFYDILRTRLFAELPSEAAVAEVAQGYAKAVREARQMDVTSASPEKFAEWVAESYPFHPAIRDLYARFKENPGFQQTRGLIRLMRTVTAQLWESRAADSSYLIAPHDIDLNNSDTHTAINGINSTLGEAISHDIAAHGQAVAERMDANLGDHDAHDALTLLLMASLSNVQGGVKGLNQSEIVANLCEPGRDLSRLKNEVLAEIMTSAWYLHSGADGKLHFRHVQNINARLASLVQTYLRDQAVKEIRERLEAMFAPQDRYCYQAVLVMSAVDEIDLSPDQVTLVIAEPRSDGLHPDLKAFFDNATYRNRVGFLTGSQGFDAVLDAAKKLKAIDQIIGELHEEQARDNDPQLVQAKDTGDRLLHQFHSALRETFTTLYYPRRNELRQADFLMEFAGNSYKGEAQIVAALKDKQKYEEDVASDVFRKKIERRLFSSQTISWREIKRRAATNTDWQWHRPDALDESKSCALREGFWREDGGVVDKGPFPQPKTDVTVRQMDRDPDSGRATLRVTPIHGDKIFVEVGGEPATSASQPLEGNEYQTIEMKVSFLAVDTSGRHETGEPVPWTNTITLQFREYDAGHDRKLEIHAAPQAATIRYATDGSNPFVAGGHYDAPFTVAPGTDLVLAGAELAGVRSEDYPRRIDWSSDNNGGRPIDLERPARYQPTQGFHFSEVRSLYGLIQRLESHDARCVLSDLTVTGDADRWISIATAHGLLLDGDALKRCLETARSLTDEDAPVQAELASIDFPTAQSLYDYAEDMKMTVNSADVVQE